MKVKTTEEYETFEKALAKVLTVSHEEMQRRLVAEKEKRKINSSASDHVSGDKD